jgi:hypothetical protein
MQHQRSLMDRTGLGLLPGIGLALAVVLVAMAALVVAKWWVTIAVLAVLLGATGAVALVVVKLIDVDGGADEHARR